MSNNHLFLSCDWGTTAFRLRLIDKNSLHIVAEHSNTNGIAAVFRQWQNSPQNATTRLAFYQSFILESIKQWEKTSLPTLNGVPIVLSGMASSTMGLMELPYRELPFSLDGSDLRIEKIAASSIFSHPMTLVSGAKSVTDVMRGEEIQLVGCAADTRLEAQVFIIPGTHSKHIFTRFDKAVSVATYMTGELFAVLSTHSILSNSIEKNGDFTEGSHRRAFEVGVHDSLERNPLNAFFQVRINTLFDKYTPSENYYYLSGLLIGLELKELIPQKNLNITLISNNVLTPQYLTALATLKIGQSLTVVNADEAIIKGHRKILDPSVKNLISKNF